MRSRRLLLTISTACVALSGCVVGPNYSRPTAPVSATFKEAEGFTPAAPADALDRGDWWTLFNDPILNDMVSKVQVTNQTLIADAAAYRQARALVEEQRAAQLPSVSGTGGATESGGGGATRTISSYRLQVAASWSLDLWGKIGRQVTAAKEQAQASEADLANATLSIQGEVISDYFGLREADAQAQLDQLSLDGYQRAETIAQNRYNAGVGTRSDLLQSQTQVINAQADLVGTKQTRDTDEHAIAVLLGKAPADFSIAQATWVQTVPAIPAGMPSTILQRRPDIASSERRMAAANEQIGIAQTAYFPSLSLTGSGGLSALQLGKLFNISNAAWSIGASGTQDIFDGGSRKAQVAAARASYDEAVANYRQTVLSALQTVENDLVETKVLSQQYQLRQQASAAADQAETIVLNQYQAGTVAYSTVITAQTSAYQARNSVLQTQYQRQQTSVALIQSLGGGWKGLEVAAK